LKEGRETKKGVGVEKRRTLEGEEGLPHQKEETFWGLIKGKWVGWH